MFHFFRRIRQSLIENNRFRKYLAYAIGEIALVMIGILLALQINNWNEERKEKREEINTLSGILSDLEENDKSLQRLKKLYRQRLSYYTYVVPSFEIDSIDHVELKDSTRLINYPYLTGRPRSYRINAGNYNSMISDGNTSLISNKKLLNDIQMLYDVHYEGALSTYETIKTHEANLSWKRSYNIYNETYQYIDDLTDQEFISELHVFFRTVRFYHGALNDARERIQELIKKTEEELEQLNGKN